MGFGRRNSEGPGQSPVFERSGGNTGAHYEKIRINPVIIPLFTKAILLIVPWNSPLNPNPGINFRCLKIYIPYYTIKPG
jgi:hypothetical protein